MGPPFLLAVFWRSARGTFEAAIIGRPWSCSARTKLEAAEMVRRYADGDVPGMPVVEIDGALLPDFGADQ